MFPDFQNKNKKLPLICRSQKVTNEILHNPFSGYPIALIMPFDIKCIQPKIKNTYFIFRVPILYQIYPMSNDNIVAI